MLQDNDILAKCLSGSPGHRAASAPGLSRDITSVAVDLGNEIVVDRPFRSPLQYLGMVSSSSPRINIVRIPFREESLAQQHNGSERRNK